MKVSSIQAHGYASNVTISYTYLIAILNTIYIVATAIGAKKNSAPIGPGGIAFLLAALVSYVSFSVFLVLAYHRKPRRFHAAVRVFSIVSLLPVLILLVAHVLIDRITFVDSILKNSGLVLVSFGYPTYVFATFGMARKNDAA